MLRLPLNRRARLALVALVTATGALPASHAAAPAELLAAYTAQAGAPASAERGQKLFTTNFGRDFGWSCSTCHTATPTGAGKDDLTGKPIAPMAPAANPKRFTDRSRVDHQFRLNCKDVVGRECSAGEKADVLAWLISLTP